MRTQFRRVLLVGLVAPLIVGVSAASGASAPKSGAKCSTKDVGKTVAASGGGSVKCTKSGKTAKWLKVVPTTSAAPAASAAPTTAAPATTAPAKPLQEATVRFFRSIPFDAGGAFWFLAQDKGYFAEQKIVGEVSTGSGAASAVAAVVSGASEIGQVSADSFLNAQAQGADLVAFWQFIPSGVFGMAYDSTKISGPAALKGKKVGVIGPSSATFFSAKLILSQNGVNPNDVQFVNLGAATPQAYAALRDGTIDALGTWDAQITAIRQAADDENKQAFLTSLVYKPSPDYLGDVLITSKKFYKENPDVLVRFTKAMVKGIQAMRDNPDDAMRSVSMANPAVRATDAAQKKILQLRISPAGALQTDGTFDIPEVTRALKLYKANAIITSDPATLDIKSLFVTDIATAVKGK